MEHKEAEFVRASDILSQPYTIEKSDRISHALEVMEKNNVNHLLVTNEGELEGLLTKQGIARTVGERASDYMVRPSSSLHVAKAMDENLITISGETPIGEVCRLMSDIEVEVLAVVNGQLTGWITFDEVVKTCKPSGYAGTIMEAPITCSPYDRVVHVRRRMIDENAWWMMAVDDDKLAGVVTESDIAKALSKFRDLVKEKYQDARVRKIIVDDVMTADVISVWTNTPCEEVVAIMLEKDVEGVPVLDLNDTLVGMITKNTILKNL